MIPQGTIAEQEVANFIGQRFYASLLERFKEIAKARVSHQKFRKLKTRAITRWSTTLRVVQQRGDILLASHIRDVILPEIQKAKDSSDALFLLFFFYNKPANKIRFWCPSAEATLRTLGFPYDVESIVGGIKGTIGLKDWEFEPHGVGLGSLTTRYLADLTERQFAPRDLIFPRGDWLAGVKSALYLRLPEEEAEVGAIVCVCSFIPCLFGALDRFDETDPKFFSPAREAVRRATSRASLKEILLWLTMISVTADEDRAVTWFHNMAGLAHRFAPEINSCMDRCKKLSKIMTDLGKSNLLSYVSTRKAKKEIDFLSVAIQEWSGFLEFLNTFAKGQLNQEFDQDTLESRLGTLPMTADNCRALANGIYRNVKKNVKQQTGAHGLPKLSRPVVQDWSPVVLLAPALVRFILAEFMTNAVKFGRRGSDIAFRASILNHGRQPQLTFAVTNELECAQIRGKELSCAVCLTRSHHRLLYRTDFCEGQTDRYYCNRCLKAFTNEWLETRCWKPTVGTDSGLGLFMTKVYPQRFYGGTFFRKIESWGPKERKIVFGFTIPQKDARTLRQNWRFDE